MEHRHDDDFEAGDQQDGASAPWKLLALLVVVAGLATFFFQNGQDSPVNFLWMSGSWPQWTVIGISVVIGVVIDRLVSRQWRRARRR
ncbi:MAG: LapA family protein [Ilumatobacteraceae bacterium]